MEGRKQFAVVGGDARQAAAARALARAGYSVGGPEKIAVADYILLPLPLDAARTPLAELLRAARPGTLALGGMLSAEAKAIAAEAGVELVDYFAREELTIRNAIPTAEGCIGILMAERSRTLWGSSILLTGFGPVGQALGVRLGALGAQVTAAARRPAQRALAESFGLRSVAIGRLGQLAPAFDTVVNTVPALVLDEGVLTRLRPESLIVDLASRPGGTDFEAARRLGHRAIHALSLPAACAPETAGVGASAGDELCGGAGHPLWPGDGLAAAARGPDRASGAGYLAGRRASRPAPSGRCPRHRALHRGHAGPSGRGSF